MNRSILLVTLLIAGGCVAPGVTIKDIEAGLILCAPHDGLKYLLIDNTAICEDKTRFRHARWHMHDNVEDST